MNSIIKADLYRYEGRFSYPLFIRYFLFTAGFRYTVLFRKASLSHNWFSKLFWTFFLRQCMLSTGIQIPASTKIGRGLYIAHFGTIVINPSAIIGSNFNIAQGCLIGSAEGKKKGAPILDDNIKMGANSIIVGGIKVGRNVLIAPNAFVNFDVPDNSIVVGNPGQIIRKEKASAKYIVYPVK